jgi:hypothetical protein
VEELVFEATGRLRLGASVRTTAKQRCAEMMLVIRKVRKREIVSKLRTAPRGRNKANSPATAANTGEDPEPESSVPSATTTAMVRSR